MRVLILSVTAGQGHNACAKAAMAALEAKGAECRMLDTLSYLNSVIGTGVDKGYLLMGKISPGVFGKLYEATLSGSQKRRRFQISDLISDNMAQKMIDYIDDFSPDCIITTHVFAALIISHLRCENMRNVFSIGINTDFSIHPLWEQVEQEHLVLASALMEYSVRLRGMDTKKILPFGIPVDAKFSSAKSKQEARAAIGLPDKTTLVLMSGSMGFGHLASQIETLDALPQDFQIVAICGSNKDAFEEISTLTEARCFDHEVFCKAFVNNVHEYMQAGDILISKPGGLSTTECLHVGRPMVIADPIPGLEEFNAAFLVNCGAAVYSDEFYPLDLAVYNLLENEKIRNNMLAAQRNLQPEPAGEKLANFVFENVRESKAPPKKHIAAQKRTVRRKADER